MWHATRSPSSWMDCEEAEVDQGLEDCSRCPFSIQAEGWVQPVGVLVSFQSVMPSGRADTPASGKLLAEALPALDGDGYRSQLDAAVSPRVYALIADLLRSDKEGSHVRLACGTQQRAQVQSGLVGARPPQQRRRGG